MVSSRRGRREDRCATHTTILSHQHRLPPYFQSIATMPSAQCEPHDSTSSLLSLYLPTRLELHEGMSISSCTVSLSLSLSTMSDADPLLTSGAAALQFSEADLGVMAEQVAKALKTQARGLHAEKKVLAAANKKISALLSAITREGICALPPFSFPLCVSLYFPLFLSFSREGICALPPFSFPLCVSLYFPLFLSFSSLPLSPSHLSLLPSLSPPLHLSLQSEKTRATSAVLSDESPLRQGLPGLK